MMSDGTTGIMPWWQAWPRQCLWELLFMGHSPCKPDRYDNLHQTLTSFTMTDHVVINSRVSFRFAPRDKMHAIL